MVDVLNRAASTASGAVRRTISVAEAQSQRSGRGYLLLGISLAAMAISLIPGVGSAIGGAISHVTDRIKNGIAARRELKLRTQYYSEQIGAIMGKDPSRVTVRDFAKAAKLNPQLRKLYLEPLNKEHNENRTSMLINGGAAAAGVLIPGSTAIANGAKTAVEGISTASTVIHAAKSIVGGLAGGAIGSVLAKDEVNAQELIESLEQALIEADRQGLPRSEAINPQRIFLLRVSQNEALGKEIKQRFGVALHKMDDQQLAGVMNLYSDLAQTSAEEAKAIAEGRLNLRNLGAASPEPAIAAPQPGGHVERLMKERAAQAANDNPAIAANDNGGFVAREEQRRAQAAQQQPGITA